MEKDKYLWTREEKLWSDRRIMDIYTQRGSKTTHLILYYNSDSVYEKHSPQTASITSSWMLLLKKYVFKEATLSFNNQNFFICSNDLLKQPFQSNQSSKLASFMRVMNSAAELLNKKNPFRKCFISRTDSQSGSVLKKRSVGEIWCKRAASECVYECLCPSSVPN